ncbi:MAG: GxxExxY protein [Anaerolineae bacterium]|jgi:GxxExxY protein
MSLDAYEEVNKITETIIGCAYRVHQTLGHGFLEKVYENALRIELEEAGLQVQQQVPVQVWYRGRPVGDYFADLLVEGRVIVEIKAVRELAKEHEVQLVHYLTATGIEDGLLINFGPSVEIKRKFRTFIPRREK